MDFGYSQINSLPSLQNDASPTTLKCKPAVPKKPFFLTEEKNENEMNRRIHVKDMVQKLQQKESLNGIIKRSNFVKMGIKPSKSLPVSAKEEAEAQASSRTLEDLKAIDEDIEKLRKQIEERDKIISALREAAEAKDKKFDNLMVEYSKLQSGNCKLDLDTSAELNNRSTSSPTSPPLCSGELCWTDSFVNKNYHEPVYAQLLNDHATLQRIYNELKSKLDSKETNLILENGLNAEEESKLDNQENAINLIMAEQIRILKEREAQLIAEAEELREQNDLMEFRILELEECRKEFLDKEGMAEGKHRTEKMVWQERDIEDISDSGVMSLPTSEDLTSDSELGDAIQNYSPLGAVTNLSLLSPDTNSDPIVPEVRFKKSLKSTEGLQESGIFEESESHPDSAILLTKQSRGCQTESILNKTLLDFIDSSCDFLLSKNRGYLDQRYSDDLSTEISKLSVIQKRIQQKTKIPPPKGPHSVFTCPHTNSILFYEERLSQLESKLKIYESSGDTKDILLSKRLEKEVELAYRVKDLTEKVATLEVTNRRLEEEKCEFEEAENDARFQCQRLEIRLQELLDKNTELELEVERHKVIMNEEKRKDRKKGNLENLIDRYEKRNFELEEREVEAKQRLSMIKAAMPAIVAWNMFRVVQNPELVQITPGTSNQDTNCEAHRKATDQDSLIIQRLEELLDDQKKLRKNYEKVEESAADREKVLRAKIDELELKAARDREMLEEMTNSLKALKSDEKCESGSTNVMRPDEIDLFEELKQMVANEIHLRAEIERLEKNEQAYMESLEKADDIWASMEADYKQRLQEKELEYLELQKRVAKLEASQMESEKTLKDDPISETILAKSKIEISAKIKELLEENEKLKLDFTKNLDKKFEEHKQFLETENLTLREELQKIKSDFINEEKRYSLLKKELEITRGEVIKEKDISDRLRKEIDDKTKSVTEMESHLQNQISELNIELSQKSKELSNLEVTVAELREEVETLENKVAELVEKIEAAPSFQEEEEIFQLSIKNTELQQTLEKMQEDSKQKEKELEELQKIAQEIREEQLKLKLLFEEKLPEQSNALICDTVISVDEKKPGVDEPAAIICEGDAAEEIGRTQSLDILQIINPIVVKTSEQMTTSVSNLQIALDNLQNKCRAKNYLIKTLLEELQQRGDNLDYQEMLNQLQGPATDKSAIDHMNHEKTVEPADTSLEMFAISEYENPRSSTPNHLGRSTSASYELLPSSAVASPKSFGHKVQDGDAGFSYAAPIRTMRRVGENGIFLEWDVSLKPEMVTGYEILVNGMPNHRVRSSTRNKALLHSLNLGERFLIQLFAISENGRSRKCSHVTYPDSHLLYRSESQ